MRPLLQPFLPHLLREISVSTLHIDKHLLPSSVATIGLHVVLPHTEPHIVPPPNRHPAPIRSGVNDLPVFFLRTQ